ncbi:MAG: transglycosylase domain-containing protein [Saprospiraceae bacterium]|nr:transglycosylase domain-containing protein [Saprospiraceae bacterium]
MERVSQIWMLIKRQFLLLLTRWRNWSAMHPRKALAIKIGGGLTGLFFFLMVLFVALIYLGAFGKVPNYADLKGIQNYTASEVYSEDGALLGKYYIENRTNADFEELSPYLIQALVATEDARFFEHHGIDFRALTRVFFKSLILRNESSGGGSTLSQQLAKNLYKRQDHGFVSMPVNKIREMIIARRLENVYDKEELLRLYLNTVPFSENIFGVKLACQRFFSASPDSLNMDQAALLIGTLKGTTYYNPVAHPDRALQRRNTVLGQMSKYGYIDTSQVDSLYQLPLGITYSPDVNKSGLAPYFREELRQELDLLLKDYPKPDGSTYNLYTDGLRIFTTIDARMQQYAETAVAEQMKKLQESFDQHWKGRKAVSEPLMTQMIQRSDRYKKWKEKGIPEDTILQRFRIPVTMTVFDWETGKKTVEWSPRDSVYYYLSLLQAGFVAMEPKTGKVRAWVGGIDQDYFKYDHVLSRRQIGSTFKPVVYAAAIEKGIDPCEYHYNQRTTYPDYENWSPENSDGKYENVYSMAGGLQHSVNTVAVDIFFETGMDTVRQMARDIGFDGDIPRAPAIALGAMEASLMEMLQVYGTFANGGFRPDPWYLLRIETASGELIADFQEYTEPDWMQVFSRQTGSIMIELLESVVDSGTAKRLLYQYYVPGDIAGKTGTTQNQSDGWFMGFTPDLVCGAWVGADYPDVHWRSLGLGQGSNTALPIWGRFMRMVYKDPAFKKWQYHKFPEPDSTVIQLLDCYPVLPDMPDSLFLGNDKFLEKILEDLFGKKSDDPITEEQRQEAIRRELERIEQEQNKWEEKEDRKQRRKEFFDNVFGREKQDGG